MRKGCLIVICGAFLWGDVLRRSGRIGGDVPHSEGEPFGDHARDRRMTETAVEPALPRVDRCCHHGYTHVPLGPRPTPARCALTALFAINR